MDMQMESTRICHFYPTITNDGNFQEIVSRSVGHRFKIPEIYVKLNYDELYRNGNWSWALWASCQS